MAQTKINASQTTITAEDIGASSSVSTMPIAAVGYLDKIVQYVGATDSTYTNGYFYKCVSDGQSTPTYSWTNVEVQASSGGLPSQSGNSGKFLTTDGTDASWATINALTNNGVSPSNGDLGILSTSVHGCVNGGTATGIGKETTALGGSSVALGYQATAGTVTSATYSCVALGPKCQATGQRSIAIGFNAQATGKCSMQIGPGVNSTANTCQLGYHNGVAFTTYQLLDFTTGTIPTDRFTTTPVADGTYVPMLSIASGTPTRSWADLLTALSTITGYDATKTQSLKNVQGVLTWVDD